MDLTLQRPGDHLFVRAVSAEGILVGATWHKSSLILSPEHLVADWAVTQIDGITELLLEPVFAQTPDVVLLGTGVRQQFLPADLMMLFYRRGIGAELMTTNAACRTFNVLASEGRRVVAALIQTGEN